ncbi:MAG: putative prokaryotic signal transducing protein [Candidatus Aminicenantes bacterium]|nr:putative prokaryotic signal transducing protein [Candidatus Aminicenantes bacterium]
MCYDEGMNWVTVHKSNGITEAEILRSMLESFGIPARVSGETIRTPFGQSIDGMGIALLLVPADRASDAQDILAEHFTAEA